MAKGVATTPNTCPRCGDEHAFSLVQASEIDSLEGLKLSALEPADYYRVYICKGGRFVAAPEEGSE